MIGPTGEEIRVLACLIEKQRTTPEPPVTPPVETPPTPPMGPGVPLGKTLG